MKKPNYQTNLIKRCYKNRTMRWDFRFLEPDPEYPAVVLKFACSHCGYETTDITNLCPRCGYLWRK